VKDDNTYEIKDWKSVPKMRVATIKKIEWKKGEENERLL
jgi:hypothetical protein